MKCRVQRNVLSQRNILNQVDKCAPPRCKYLNPSIYQNERAFLCTSKKGSLTVEAALLIPFVLMILLAFFSFFSQYASAAKLQADAAAEAKKAGIALGAAKAEDGGDLTIYKTEKIKVFWLHPFWKKEQIVQKAVCRGWVGFTTLEETERFVYITPEGSVYHLFSDCTHLELSIRGAAMAVAKKSKNDYGQTYRKCELCDKDFGGYVYITSEGDCYHSDRNCSGLKRTIRQVPFGEVSGRNLCLRCMSREE